MNLLKIEMLTLCNLHLSLRELFALKFFPAGIVLILTAGLACPLSGEAAERIRLVYADRMESATEGTEVLRKLIGNVRLSQGSAYMDCDEAVLSGGDERARLKRNVKIFDGKRTLWADQVNYDGRKRVEEALGHAVVKSGAKTISADRIEYRQETEEVFARWHVAVSDSIERLLLESDSAYYSRRSDYARVEGNPRAVKYDTSAAKKDWHLSGLRMETWGKEKRSVITDSASIEQTDMKAKSRIAEFWSGRDLLILRSSPEVIQSKRLITGDSMAIHFKDMRFQGGQVFGKARIVSSDSAGQDELKGSRITIEARGDTLDRVTIDGQAESYMRVEDKQGGGEGVNTATGDRIVLEFEGGKLKRVDVTSRPGLSTGKYASKEKKDNE